MADVCRWLQGVAPLELSETWDNTGLLLGDPAQAAERVMTCLTLTPASVAEAVAARAQMVVVHHPLPFKPLAKLTTQTVAGGMLWSLARAGISVYAPHTAWDSAARGINARLAELLGLADVQPLLPADPVAAAGVGSGRIGNLADPQPLSTVIRQLSAALPGCRPRVVLPELHSASHGDEGASGGGAVPVRRVAIACGSGGSLLPAAAAAGSELFLTGEATFHTCLEAQAAGVSLLMVGHFASERFAMEQLADEMGQALPGLQTWASQNEKDPVRNCSPQGIPW